MRASNRMLRNRQLAQKRQSWAPKYLFAAGVNGAWYDPSDINLTWRRNLLKYSEQFDNAAWEKVGAQAITANAIAAPDGTQSADKLRPSAVSDLQAVYQARTFTATSHTVSISAKAAEYSWLFIRVDGVNNGHVWFNLGNGTVGTTAANRTPTISSQGNGWYRCTVSWVSIGGSGNVLIGASNADNVITFAGDGTSGIYIWGAQLELGSTATPYQRITDGIKDYLDYNPLPILYQDAAGTTPVTAVGQPVGLMLDKRLGLVLGSELAPQDTTTTVGWNPVAASPGTVTASSSGIRVYSPAGETAGFGLTGLDANKTYVVTFTVTRVAGSLELRGVPGLILTSSGTYTVREKPEASGTIRWYRTGSTTDFTISTISVRELPGNHAFNPSGNSANFPVLSARYNLLNNTETLATQSVTTRAAKYILSFWGTGSVALSGTYTGTLVGTGADNRVYVEFTATAGTLTLTVTGSVLKAQLEEL